MRKIKLIISLVSILMLIGCDQTPESLRISGSDTKESSHDEGVELRTDGHGAVHASSGIFISADTQPKDKDQILEMDAALAQLNEALDLVLALAQGAAVAGALPADFQSQSRLKETLVGLKGAGLVASAPAGIALTTPSNIQLSTGQTLTGTARDSADFSVFKRFSVAAGGAISLYAHNLGMKLIASKGPVDISARSDAMTLHADKKLELGSINGEIMLDAKQGITLYSGGAYIKIKDGSIEIGAPGELRIRNDNVLWGGPASLEKALTALPPEDSIHTDLMQGGFQVKDKVTGKPKPYVKYRIETSSGNVIRGVTDKDGYTQRYFSPDPETMKLFFE